MLNYNRVVFGLLFLVSTGHVMADTKSVVTIVSPWEVASFDLAMSGFAIQKLQIMENLVDVDATGMLRPGLATSWSTSKDGLVWEFNLRDDVLFHDGSKFNAGTAVFALSRAWSKPGILKKAPITDIVARDGKVMFQLDKPFAALPAFLAHATTIIPARSAFNADDKPFALIGTGPFAVAEFTPPQSISLVRFDDYWGKNARLEKAIYLAAGRAETRALLAESGDADIVFTLDAAGYSHLQGVENLVTKAVPIPRVVVLKINAGHRFFNDPKVRQALSLSIPRDGIAQAITRFPEAAAGQLFPPALNA